jgi:hypothetical protein
MVGYQCYGYSSIFDDACGPYGPVYLNKEKGEEKLKEYEEIYKGELRFNLAEIEIVE